MGSFKQFIDEYENGQLLLIACIPHSDGTDHYILYPAQDAKWYMDFGTNKISFSDFDNKLTKTDCIFVLNTITSMKDIVPRVFVQIGRTENPRNKTKKTVYGKLLQYNKECEAENKKQVEIVDISKLTTDEEFGPDFNEKIDKDKKNTNAGIKGYDKTGNLTRDVLIDKKIFKPIYLDIYEKLGGKLPNTIDNIKKLIKQEYLDQISLDDLTYLYNTLSQEDLIKIWSDKYTAIELKHIFNKTKYADVMQHFISATASGNQSIPDDTIPLVFILNAKDILNLKVFLPKAPVRQSTDNKKDAATQKEISITNAVDDWIKRDEQRKENPNIDDITNNTTDRFYSIHSGKDTSKSDVMVVHDKKEYNKDKKRPTEKDNIFFIEAKLSENARSFNPTVKIVESGDEYKFEYTGFVVPSKQKSNLNQIDKTAINEDNIEDEKYREMMTDEDLGQTLTAILSKHCTKTLNILKNMVNIYEAVFESNKYTKIVSDVSEVKTMEFPRDFKNLPKMFDIIFEYLMCVRENRPTTMTQDQVDKLADILDQNNINLKRIKDLVNQKMIGSKQKSIRLYQQIANDLSDIQKKTLMMYLVNGDILQLSQKYIKKSEESDLLDELADRIISWYADHKKTAYIEVGPNDTGTHAGGVYIFRKDFDPLNLQNKYRGQINTLKGAITGAMCVLRKRAKKDSFVVNFVLDLIPNGLQMEDILNDNFKMNSNDEVNDKTKFFK